MLWNSLFPPPVAPPTEPEPAAVTATETETPTKESSKEPVQPQDEADPPPQDEPQKVRAIETEEKTHELGDNKRQITFSNHGAHPVSITLVDQAHNKIYREPGTDEDRPVVDLAAQRQDFAPYKSLGSIPKHGACLKRITIRLSTLRRPRPYPLNEPGPLLSMDSTTA